MSLNASSPILPRAGVTGDLVFDRRDTANQQQQQKLLALFKKPSVAALKQDAPVVGLAREPFVSAATSPLRQAEGSNGAASARLMAAVRKVQQRVPTMKTGATGGVSLGGSVPGDTSAPMSPLKTGGAVAFAKDAFLLSYLEGVAKGAGK